MGMVAGDHDWMGVAGYSPVLALLGQGQVRLPRCQEWCLSTRWWRAVCWGELQRESQQGRLWVLVSGKFGERFGGVAGTVAELNLDRGEMIRFGWWVLGRDFSQRPAAWRNDTP
jgi:hypothetical protein